MVYGNVVYMGTVKTWHVVICVVYNKLEKVFKSHGDSEAHSWCSPPLSYEDSERKGKKKTTKKRQL